VGCRELASLLEAKHHLIHISPFQVCHSSLMGKVGLIGKGSISGIKPSIEEGISDYLIRGKTGEVLPKIVEEARKTG
jgi:hypothetical protein